MCALRACGEFRCMRRKAPAEPSSSSASYSPLNILQESRLIRPVGSEGYCVCSAPGKGRACLCWAPDCGQTQGPCLHSPPRGLGTAPGKGLKYRVPAVGIRRCPPETRKVSCRDFSLLRNCRLRALRSSLVLTSLLRQFRKHSTYRARLAF